MNVCMSTCLHDDEHANVCLHDDEQVDLLMCL